MFVGIFLLFFPTFVFYFFVFFNARSIIKMQLKDDSRAMSNSRPSLIWQGEVLTLNPPPSAEVVASMHGCST